MVHLSFSEFYWPNEYMNSDLDSNSCPYLTLAYLSELFVATRVSEVYLWAACIWPAVWLATAYIYKHCTYCFSVEKLDSAFRINEASEHDPENPTYSLLCA